MTSNTVELSCRCGSLRGQVRNVGLKAGGRFRCYCDDCQTYAYFLDQAEEVLDAHGGTEVYATTHAQIELSDGLEHLSLMRQSPKGLMRWYASCCNTPVANCMPSPRSPFCSLVRPFVKLEDDGPAGAVLGGVQSKYARGEKPEDASAGRTVGVIWHASKIILGGMIKGRNRPSPFFRDGQPVREARILTLDERQALRAKAGV